MGEASVTTSTWSRREFLEDEAERHVGLAVEGAELPAGVELDDGEARVPCRDALEMLRAVVAPLGARRAARGALGRRSARRGTTRERGVSRTARGDRAFLRSGEWLRSSMTAQGPQRDRAVEHRARRTGCRAPAARRSRYCRRSAAWRLSRQGWQVVPPSCGRVLAAADAEPGFEALLLAPLALGPAGTSLGFSIRTAVFQPGRLAGGIARAGRPARRFSRHGSQDVRPSTAGACPHLVHRPAARRDSTSRRDRSRSYSRARPGSLRGIPAARSRASRARAGAIGLLVARLAQLAARARAAVSRTSGTGPGRHAPRCGGDTAPGRRGAASRRTPRTGCDARRAGASRISHIDPEPCAPRPAGNTSSTAPLGDVTRRTVRVTHPFHPLHGREFELIEITTIGVGFVQYRGDDGALRTIRQAYTSAAAVDPFVRIAAGRSAFRVSDLLALATFLDSLDRDDRTGSKADGGAEAVKEILPHV